jgi:hypothetical protein
LFSIEGVLLPAKASFAKTKALNLGLGDYNFKYNIAAEVQRTQWFLGNFSRRYLSLLILSAAKHKVRTAEIILSLKNFSRQTYPCGSILILPNS